MLVARLGPSGVGPRRPRSADRVTLSGFQFELDLTVGFSAELNRLPNLNAALGLAQIAQLDAFVTQKRELAKYYSEWLGQWPQAIVFMEPDGARSNFWLNAISLPDQDVRDEVLRRTNEFGVMTRPMWTPMNTLPMYQDCQQFNLNNVQAIESTFVNIPSSVVSLK